MKLGTILAAIEDMELFPVSPEVARSAARIAESQGIRGCDAIYVALALLLNDVLVTFDLQQANCAREINEVVVPA